MEPTPDIIHTIETANLSFAATEVKWEQGTRKGCCTKLSTRRDEARCSRYTFTQIKDIQLANLPSQAMAVLSQASGYH